MHALNTLAFAFCAWTIAEAKNQHPACAGGLDAALVEESGEALLQSSLLSSSVPMEGSLSPASSLIPGYDPATPEGSGAAPGAINNGVDLASTDSGYYYGASGPEAHKASGVQDAQSADAAQDGYYHHGDSVAESEPSKQVVKGEVGSDAQVSFDGTSEDSGASNLHPDVGAHILAPGSSSLGTDVLPPNILAATNHATAALSGSSDGIDALPPNILAATNHAKAALSGGEGIIDASASSRASDVGTYASQDAHEATVLPDGVLSNGHAVPASVNVASDTGNANVVGHPTAPPSTSAMLSMNEAAGEVTGVESKHNQQQLKSSPQQLQEQPQQQQAFSQPLQRQLLQSQQGTQMQQLQQPALSQQLQYAFPTPLQQQPQVWQLQAPTEQNLQQRQYMQQQLQNPMVGATPAQVVGPPLNAGVPNNFAGFTGAATLATSAPPGLSYAPLQQGVMYSATPQIPGTMIVASSSGTPQILVAQPDVAVPKASFEANSADNVSAETMNRNTSGSFNTTSSPSNASIATSSTTLTTTFPVDDKMCRTRNDDRAVVWYMETAQAGTPCVFGVDPRDEGGHCIFDQGRYGSNGWCYTDKDRYAWGSCDDKCPLYGVHAALGKKIDSVTEQVEDVSKQLDDMFATTTANPTLATFAATPTPNISTSVAPATAAPEVTPTEPSIETPTAVPATTLMPSTTPMPPIPVEPAPAPPAPAPAPPAPAPNPEPVPATSPAPAVAAPSASTNSNLNTGDLAAAPGAWPGTSDANVKPGISDLAAAPGPFPGLMQHQVMPDYSSNMAMPSTVQTQKASAIDTSNIVWNQILVAAQRHDLGTLRQLLSGD